MAKFRMKNPRKSSVKSLSPGKRKPFGRWKVNRV